MRVVFLAKPHVDMADDVAAGIRHHGQVSGVRYKAVGARLETQR